MHGHSRSNARPALVRRRQHRGGSWPQPLSLDQADNFAGSVRDHRCATLAQPYLMVEEKQFRVAPPLLQLRKSEIEHFSRCAIIQRPVQSVGVQRLGRASGWNHNTFALHHPVGCQRQIFHRVWTFERIRRGSQDCHIVRTIYDHQFGSNKPGTSRRIVQQNVCLASAQLAQHVCCREEISLLVDEEAVSVEQVVIAPVRRSPIGRSLIHGIDDRAYGVGQQRVVRGIFGRSVNRRKQENASQREECCDDRSADEFQSHEGAGRKPSPTTNSVAQRRRNTIDLKDSSAAAGNSFKALQSIRVRCAAVVPSKIAARRPTESYACSCCGESAGARTQTRLNTLATRGGCAVESLLFPDLETWSGRATVPGCLQDKKGNSLCE